MVRRPAPASPSPLRGEGDSCVSMSGERVVAGGTSELHARTTLTLPLRGPLPFPSTERE